MYSKSSENFPVASVLLAPHRRRHVAQFYALARYLDDVADDPHRPLAEKLSLLEACKAVLQRGLSGVEDGIIADAEASRRVEAYLQTTRTNGVSVQYMVDLIDAFCLEAKLHRCASWDELMALCRLSAAPVGRWLVALHMPFPSLLKDTEATDALCAALQVLNHIQDCADDYRRLGRIYIPRSFMEEAAMMPEDLEAACMNEATRTAIGRMLDGVDGLLWVAQPLAGSVPNTRLGLEVGGIHALARALATRLRREDVLQRQVRLWPLAKVMIFAKGAILAAGVRMWHAVRGRGAGEGTVRRRSSFYWAMRLLPPTQRAAMFILYDYCRYVDDIADGSLSVREKRALLRQEYQWIKGEQMPDKYYTPLHRAVAAIRARYPLQQSDFLCLLDGMIEDSTGRVTMKNADALAAYVDKVSSSVGRLICAIIGIDDDADAYALSHAMGSAFQLTNILRDGAEDLARGRLYLPLDALRRAGLSGVRVGRTIPTSVWHHPATGQVWQDLLEEAQGHFEEARALLRPLSRTQALAPVVMLERYAQLLHRLRPPPHRGGHLNSVDKIKVGWRAAWCLLWRR